MGARHFGVGEETTWGTAVTPTRFFEALSESIQREKAYEEIATIRSYSTQEIVTLNEAVRGDVEILANYEGIGILLKHLIGSVETTGSGPYTHRFPASSGIPSTDRRGLGLTIEMRRDDSLVWTYKGAKIISLTHTFGTDQSSRMTFGFLAKDEATGSSATSPTYSTLEPMYPRHVTVSINDQEQPASSCTITIENPLDEPFLLGSTGLGREPDRSDVLKVKATVEVLFDSLTEYNLFANDNSPDVDITADNGTQSIDYWIRNARITQATPHVSGRDRLKATYEITGYYYNDADESVRITLVNNDSTP